MQRVHLLTRCPVFSLHGICLLQGEAITETLVSRDVRHVFSITGSAFLPASDCFDAAGIRGVDAEDLPQNLWALEAGELRAVCASYGVACGAGDAKVELIAKLERARFKGSQVLLLGN